jgi:hypothetical protein
MPPTHLVVYLELVAMTPIEGLSECCFVPSLVRLTFGMTHRPGSVPNSLTSVVVCHDCGAQQIPEEA